MAGNQAVRAARLAAFALLAATAPAGAEMLPHDSEQVKVAAGAWDLVAKGGQRCRIQLNPKGTRDKLVVGMPPACRGSMARLSPAMIWGIEQDGRIVLSGADGRVLASFTRRPDGGFASEGDEHVLTPVGGRYQDAERKRVVTAALAPPPVDDKTTAMAGRWRVARDRVTVGCEIDLATKPAQAGGYSAALAAGCKDDGLAVFDPAGWRLEGDRLFLVARKGHSIGFSKGQDGVWFKDPAQGRPLFLRR